VRSLRSTAFDSARIFPRSKSHVGEAIRFTEKTSPVVANRVGWATIHGLSCERKFLRRFRLAIRNRQSNFVVAPERRGGIFATEVAIDAGLIYVEPSRSISGVFRVFVSHNNSNFSGASHCGKFIRIVTVIPGMNEFLATGPFDLYELQLFHLVAEHQSFTKAGRAAGLTQSAITRQIRGMEERLRVSLFERTTRSVQLTAAGAALYGRSGGILSGVSEAIGALRAGFDLAPKVLTVGIARTIGLAYLPGFFRRFQKHYPRVQLRVRQESSGFILGAVESGEVDVGIVAEPAQLSRAIEVRHRFTDEFVAIAPPAVRLRMREKIAAGDLGRVFGNQRWVLVSEETITGKRLRGWLARNGVKIEPLMQTDNFDLIANVVSLGFGVSLVPHRVLALHPKNRPVQRVVTEPKYARELIVVARKHANLAAPVQGFLESVLF
jgi:DNA-binding transcriptional LysR family regulator